MRMKRIDSLKWDYINKHIISNSISAAFGRAKVYRTGVDGKNPNRDRLREALAGLLEASGVKYRRKVSSAEHTKTIKKISDTLSRQFKGKRLLCKDRFRIGIAQKALNVYLKYLWTLGKIVTPPHCPFDYGIIQMLPLGKEEKKALTWTKLDTIRGYQKMVEAAEIEVKSTGHTSIAEWELNAWEDIR